MNGSVNLYGRRGGGGDEGKEVGFSWVPPQHSTTEAAPSIHIFQINSLIQARGIVGWAMIRVREGIGSFQSFDKPKNG